MTPPRHSELRSSEDPSRFNETVLQRYGLVFYEANRTLSNKSNCYYIAPAAVEEPFPILYENGSILPVPKLCSDSVRPIGIHGIGGIAFGCVFIVSLVLISFNLQQHHQRGKSQRTGGKDVRRQWFLAFLAAIAGVVTSFVAIDVDREIISGLPFKLQGIFYSLEQMTLLLTMFEATHTWLSQLEHVLGISTNTTNIGGRRIDLWLVSCYILIALAVGLVVVRDWNDLSAQWYPAQIEQIAMVAGTDARLKAGYLIALFCVTGVAARLLIVGIRHYKLVQNTTSFAYSERILRLTLVICLCTWIAVYNTVSSFVWHISPYNIDVSQRYYYCGGLLPCVTALILLNVIGIVENHDESNMVNTATEVRAGGINVRKPRWWRYSRQYTSDDDAIPLNLRNFRDIRGRNEKYENTRSWWWQKDSDLENNAGSDHQLEQSSLELDQMTQELSDTSSPEFEDRGSESTHASALRQPTLTDTKARRKQASVRSMLDI